METISRKQRINNPLQDPWFCIVSFFLSYFPSFFCVSFTHSLSFLFLSFIHLALGHIDVACSTMQENHLTFFKDFIKIKVSPQYFLSICYSISLHLLGYGRLVSLPPGFSSPAWFLSKFCVDMDSQRCNAHVSSRCAPPGVQWHADAVQEISVG